MYAEAEVKKMPLKGVIKAGENGRIPTLMLILLFALMALSGCLLAFLVTLTSVASTENETFYELVPTFAGLMVAGLGGALMTSLRRRYRMGWLALLVLLVIWLLGTALFFFGGTAVFFYDEPSQFVPNLGFALGMCIVPGGLLALLALGIYFLYAWRSRRASTNPDIPSSNPVDEAGWLQILKDQEKEDR